MYHAPCRHTNDRNGAAASAPADPGGCPHDVRQLGQRPGRDPWPGFDHTNGVWEVGYCIGKAWWNKGFTTEALKAVVEYWFKNTDSSWLACCHAFENPASGRVQQKAGFVYDHDAVYHKFDGTPVACRCYALTREHYEELRGLF